MVFHHTWLCDELINEMANQTPEQKARDLIDMKLVEAGWAVQSKEDINLNAAPSVAIREYTSDTGPMDYMLMVDGKPCDVIEAKRTSSASCSATGPTRFLTISMRHWPRRFFR